MIRLRGVTRCFQLGEQRVMGLDDVDLDVAAGDYVAVMGPSGSGKSTLLNVLGLLDAPDAGEYWLQGEATAGLSEGRRAELRSRLIGFIFQSYHLIPRLTALENIELPMLLAGIDPAERRRRSSALVERLGLGDRIAHRPGELSGGQRQRVAIARAMIMQPSLLLADEPTGNLDSRSGAEVVALLEELNGEGLTLIVVTHDPSLGQRAARQLNMRDGRIIEDIQRERCDARG
ncbi:macrolide ABC transporter ATP-binding protein [Pseudomonas sp. PIC25]|uniref:ABC transporter ATP-binding protein n=1 Tax=Pseudomonas sp. PIC25 TaxID=1958773 RepID=UPI000BAB72B9|nr:ABC transporter ATP-binding protein [Pseudomonas sp. PIC25]PAU51311.1 macrolide ABC transporter ATP-binding protein [Pseudomonas sp. PIC25]